ncbi:hypothetical protein J2741_001261 [Methanolinea mesophila]|uniref:hypothetical protein n=1 Tax=Methanolinea mesophila TaxID=547055 RepID=UPI001AEAD73C|nr:hypothetical protein [Methanolinea mesophila]MBP1928714.1 hypothetical protein [Methanolinea mesophila]
MARLNDEGQWIVLMGFVISISIFILAIIVSQSALVGQTTSESVLEFSKNDIQDLRSEIMSLKERGLVNDTNLKDDIVSIALQKQNAVIVIENRTDSVSRTEFISIHFNNGITIYNETYEENY